MNYLTVGPTELYPTLKKHLTEALKKDIPSLSHRSLAFEVIFSSTVNHLRQLMAIPDSHHIFFTSSSIESMERVIENTVEKYSFHLVNGGFSNKFYKTAQALKKSPQKYAVVPGQSFGKFTVPKNTELICLTYNETATGTSLPTNFLSSLSSNLTPLRQGFAGQASLTSSTSSISLTCLDIVSCAPYPVIDWNLINMAFFSVQKCFGLPAGLGVLIVDDKAIQKSQLLEKKGLNIGSYHRFPELLKYAQKNQTPATPNVLYIYLLGKITEDFLALGIDKIRVETDKKAELIYDFFDAHPRYKPFIADKSIRSKTTITINTGADTDQVVERLKQNGIVVGRGYGEFKNTQIRIANFPAHKKNDIQKLLRLFILPQSHL